MDTFQWKVWGYSGGYQHRQFDVSSYFEGEMNLWDKKEMTKWNLITVYGIAQNDKKDAFLSELATFFSRNKEPFLIGGDFNIIRFPSEKNKPSK